MNVIIPNVIIPNVIMLNVIMPNAYMQNVIILIVNMQNVNMLNDVMLNVVMFSDIKLHGVMLNVNVLSVNMLNVMAPIFQHASLKVRLGRNQIPIGHPHLATQILRRNIKTSPSLHIFDQGPTLQNQGTHSEGEGISTVYLLVLNSSDQLHFLLKLYFSFLQNNLF